MRTFTIYVALAAAAIASTSSLVAADVPMAGDDFHAAARRVSPEQPPQVTPYFLAERQGLGGGDGSTTSTSAGLQSISGYTAPASTALAEPTVASGTILKAAQIPGYNESVNSGAEALFVGNGLAALTGGAAAGAVMLLF